MRPWHCQQFGHSSTYFRQDSMPGRPLPCWKSPFCYLRRALPLFGFQPGGPRELIPLWRCGRNDSVTLIEVAESQKAFTNLEAIFPNGSRITRSPEVVSEWPAICPQRPCRHVQLGVFRRPSATYVAQGRSSRRPDLRATSRVRATLAKPACSRRLAPSSSQTSEIASRTQPTAHVGAGTQRCPCDPRLHCSRCRMES